MIMFLSSTNREIVKAALGYVKIAIMALPQSTIKPYLKDLVPALLARSHDKKNPFKAPVMRVLSQMIKRYGYETIRELGANEENAPVLTYVRKRAERARKKKAAREQGGEDDADSDAVRDQSLKCNYADELSMAQPRPKVTSGNAFEDVLYGSDSDDSDAESENEQAKKPAAKVRPKQREPRLRVDDDLPLDLMHGGASYITSTHNTSPSYQAPS